MRPRSTTAQGAYLQKAFAGSPPTQLRPKKRQQRSALHSQDGGGQREYREAASLSCATSLAAVLHVFPILRPFLAPLKGQTAVHADLWRKTVLDLRNLSHK